MRFSQILSEQDNAIVEQLLGLGEARAGGALSTRAASQAAGQSIGKNIAAGQISGDTQADIAAAKAKVPAGTAPAAAPALGDRLASYKAKKGANPTPPGTPTPAGAPSPAPAGSPGTPTPAGTTSTNTTVSGPNPTPAGGPNPAGGGADETEPASGGNAGSKVNGFLRGAGNFASQAIGGIGQVGGAAIGGFQRGLAGGKAGHNFSAIAPTYNNGSSGANNPNSADNIVARQAGAAGASSGVTPSTRAAGDSELADLRARLDSVERLLRARP